MKKFATALILCFVSIMAFGQSKVLSTGELFKFSTFQYLEPLGIPYNNNPVATISEICQTDESRAKLVIQCDRDKYTYYVHEGDTLFMWGVRYSLVKFAFHDSSEADKVYDNKKRYLISKIKDNYIEINIIY